MKKIIATTFILITLSACAASRPAPQTQPSAMPTDGNAGSMYVWCRKEAERKSPSASWTIYGEAFVNEFTKVCMLQAGAKPVVVMQ